MTINENSIYFQPVLTTADLQNLDALQAQMLTHGVKYKIDPTISSGILCYKHGELAAFMSTDALNPGTVETAAVLKNASQFDALLPHLLTFAKERAANEILFICDVNDTAISQKLADMGLTPSFHEYRMAFDEDAFSPAALSNVSIKPANEGDAAFIAALDAESWGSSLPLAPAELRRTNIIYYAGERAGKFRTEETGDTCGIYGVVVEQSKRAKGIATKALSLFLEEHVGSGVEIYLEVDSLNTAAMHLYEKLGFKIKADFAYYPYSL